MYSISMWWCHVFGFHQDEEDDLSQKIKQLELLDFHSEQTKAGRSGRCLRITLRSKVRRWEFRWTRCLKTEHDILLPILPVASRWQDNHITITFEV